MGVRRRRDAQAQPVRTRMRRATRPWGKSAPTQCAEEAIRVSPNAYACSCPRVCEGFNECGTKRVPPSNKERAGRGIKGAITRQTNSRAMQRQGATVCMRHSRRSTAELSIRLRTKWRPFSPSILAVFHGGQPTLRQTQGRTQPRSSPLCHARRARIGSC